MIKLLIAISNNIPFSRVRRKIVYRLLDHSEDMVIRSKNGFFINYIKNGQGKTVRNQVIAGEYEADEISIYKKIIFSNDIVIDIGANEGFISLLFSQLVGNEGHVYSVEPDQWNVAILNQNIELNEIKNIHIINCAVGEERSVKKFYFTIDPKCKGGGAWGSLLNNPMANTDKALDVQVEKLDELCKDLKSISLIKIDIEGYEYNALKGAKEIIRKTQPTISFEVNLSKWADLEVRVSDMFQFLKNIGYELFVTENGYLKKMKWLNSRIMNVFAVHTERVPYFKMIGVISL